MGEKWFQRKKKAWEDEMRRGCVEGEVALSVVSRMGAVGQLDVAWVSGQAVTQALD